MNSFILRLYLTGKTVLSVFALFPIRLRRFLTHFFQWIPNQKSNHLPSKSLGEWAIDLVFYSIDILMIPDIFELIFTILSPEIRQLNSEEEKYIARYFKNRVHTNNIRISPSLPKFFNSFTLALVTFNTIHFNRKISIPIFIHEVVHIWQYQRFGSVYIYRALKAQKSKEGYDYGGLENLYSKMIANFAFNDFNFEQQGEIFEDYCRYKEEGETMNPIVSASYEYFIGQVRDAERA